MDIYLIFSFGLVAMLSALFLRQKAPEFALLLSLFASVGILLALLPDVSLVMQRISSMGQDSGLTAEIITPVLQTVGISLICKLTAELCRDAKEAALASFIELAASLAILVLTLPLLARVLELIGGLL